MRAKFTKKRGTRKATSRKGRLASREALASKPLPVAEDLPLYCDYTCPKADFPPADAVGACRREQAVWCSILEEFNTKNSRCRVTK